jgi:hypothetical protein
MGKMTNSLRSDRLFLFSYFGGKSKLTHLYPPPTSNLLVEPFAGAANYSCAHYRKQVILYELNPVIFGILDFLVRSSPQDILDLPLVRIGECVDDLPICQEARSLIGMFVNPGCVRPQRFFSERALLRQNFSWGRGQRFRLSCYVRKIKHWKVRNRSCWEAFDAYENRDDVTWFIDPPLPGETRRMLSIRK